MFLSTEGFPQAHRILGIVNATSHLAMPTEAIDSFESMDQLFSDVQEKLKRRASEKAQMALLGFVLLPMLLICRLHQNSWS